MLNLKIQEKAKSRNETILTDLNNITLKLNIEIMCNECKFIYVKKVKSYKNEANAKHCLCGKKTSWNFEMVVLYIKNNGDTLLSTKYVHSKSLLDILCCNCNEQYKQNIMRYKMGHRHFNCKKGRYKKPITYIDKICTECQKPFVVKKENKGKKMCSTECFHIYMKNRGKTEEHIRQCRKGGFKSVRSQGLRSKNEVYFAELCKKQFKTVLENEALFDGWDADITLPELKIAIRWNGIWHYKKLMPKHDLEGVQKRDKIKEQKMVEKGFTPYIIKDMGGYNRQFVEFQFETFLNYLDFLHIEG